MKSYTRHRRLASQICELAETLALESEQFHRAAARRRRPRRLTSTLDRSTEWLQHGFRSLMMGLVALREADQQLHRPQSTQM